MNLDKYQQAWKDDSAQMHVTVDTKSLSKEVQQSQEDFQTMVFWRDVREAGTSLVLIPIWLVMGFMMSLPWTWYLTVPALIWVAGFILVDRKRHPQRPSQPGEPLLFYAKESLTQVEHQIWLLRNVFWWYLLPFCISIMAFFLDTAWDTSSHWLVFALFGGFLTLFLVVLYWSVYRLNQRAVRDQLEPRRHDVLKLVDHLEHETDDEESSDIMELVSSLAAPIQDVGLSPGWERWADNWNSIVPSWFTVAAIVLPTLGGALCGLVSGLWLQIPEMGPTLFQAVVGAVIPFEIMFFGIWWRSSRKKKQSIATDHEQASLLAERLEPTGSSPEGVSPDATLEKPMRLPKAPALVILFLILFLSTMAFVALAFAVSYFRGDSSSRDVHRLSEPDFGDVSALSGVYLATIDTWLQAQVDLAKYPSLTVAIVRDGEIAYGGVFGFEDIKTGKKATLQTQYHVASVTKAFTASLAVMLHEQGVVNLDQPVATYLPDDVSISTSPELGATITLRQLASHTSGLPRGVPGPVQAVEGWYELDPQRLYDHLANVKLESDPGTAEEYSNLGFGLLAHALEGAADKPLAQLLQELICDPLKLEKTAIQASDKIRPATGYDDSGRNVERTHSFRERLAGSGGLVTSVEDLSKFLAAQLEPGVFTKEMLEELHTRTRLSDNSMTGTALGWSIKYSNFIGRFMAKSGGRSNCSAWIGFSQEYRTGVAVVTNCGGPDVDRIGRWLLEHSISGGYKPVTKHGTARVSPYTGVRWENDRPIVRVQDRWSPLVSINEIPVDQIMEFANQEYGEKARQRFTEDLVRLLSEMGNEPNWNVTLGLEAPDGQVEQMQILMTEDNRYRAREYRLKSE